MLRVLDLFAGIGGFSLGLEMTGGFETVAFCEIEKYPQEILKKNFADVPIYEDVRSLTADRLIRDGVGNIDVITGGYPCQPFSVAGKQKGEADDRHLWPFMLKIIAQVRPSWVICENVSGHISLGLDQVLFDLENEGYATRTFVVPACAVNAPHRRDRLWIVAHAGSTRSATRVSGSVKRKERDTRKPFNSHHQHGRWSPKNHWTVEPSMGRVANGIPRRVAKLKALGNAVVPQIPMIIGQSILDYENAIKKR